MQKWLFLGCALLALAGSAQAGSPAIYEKSVKGDLAGTYDRVYKALEDNDFYVIFEPNIGDNLAKFAEQWGDDYNRNKLEGIRGMVFCNGDYANAMSNADPTMLALCPLHITLTQKAGKTTVLFVRPSAIAKGSKAAKLSKEIEIAVIKAIESGLHAK